MTAPRVRGAAPADRAQEPAVQVRLDRFTPGDFTRGRPLHTEVAWLLVKRLFFTSSLPWPMRLKRRLLRAFGAAIGEGFYLRPRVNIHFPWRLHVGDHCWIGEGCEILNFEPFTMADHSALAHFVYIAAGSHDISSPTMAYANAPISLGTGAWVGTRAFIGPGVHVGHHAVVAAAAVVVRDVAPFTVVGGSPARRIKTRIIRPLSDQAEARPGT